MGKAPQIVIGDKKYTMPKPKIKLWRKLVKFYEAQQSGELDGDEVIDELIDIIVVAFNVPEITKDTVEENVSFDELAVIFEHIREQVDSLANNKSAILAKNGGTPTGT